MEGQGQPSEKGDRDAISELARRTDVPVKTLRFYETEACCQRPRGGATDTGTTAPNSRADCDSSARPRPPDSPWLRSVKSCTARSGPGALRHGHRATDRTTSRRACPNRRIACAANHPAEPDRSRPAQRTRHRRQRLLDPGNQQHRTLTAGRADTSTKRCLPVTVSPAASSCSPSWSPALPTVDISAEGSAVELALRLKAFSRPGQGCGWCRSC